MVTTRNPRVNVCVTPEQHSLLAALGRLQHRSAASLVREMVDAATPLMRKTVDLLSLAEEAQGVTRQAAREALRSVLEELQALTGDPNQLDLLALIPELADSGEEADPAPIGEREEAASSPPSSNTGVRVEPTGNGDKSHG